ncbi:NLR family CARD domain-containing protein 3 isoform X3 [Oryzias melastigma]|uniref:NLR family CARD domain-containing protein 3 isoform X3 n=1 Tax=Oryzias melastigma TaxID=30732 RepID=UPI00168CFA8A|nr:NLR family CARD domain-containing protein 3 isoform X3 [Oryzias melastigma]
MSKKNKNPPASSTVSLKSDQSADYPLNFKEGRQSPETRMSREKKNLPASSTVSLKSDRSADYPLNFKDGHQSPETRMEQEGPEMLRGQSEQQIQTELDTIFTLLEKNIATFVKNELNKFRESLKPDFAKSSTSQKEKEEVGSDDAEPRQRSRAAFLNITQYFLREMKQEKLADLLHSKSIAPECQSKMKSNLKDKFQCLFEAIAKMGNPTLLNEIYTELYITEGGTEELNEKHEVRQIEAAFRKAETSIRHVDIFKPPPERKEPIRTVMTKGVAGIGKTVLTQKFTLDWAEGKANQNIHFIFPFTFRELNVLKKKFSLIELIHHFFPATKEAKIWSFEDFQIIFIFDGLDECRFPLDFRKTQVLSDHKKPAKVGKLLTNLIRGNLLPSAYIWITTRPAAANHIPAQLTDMVTEVRGFNDPQKEEYFRKRFKNESQSSRIISHIKSAQSLHIMCHIPVFCWITATVLEDLLKTREVEKLPKSLTEMYIHFLVVQAKVKKVKYDGGFETDPHWTSQSRQMIESLGKLAFEQLQKGNLIFYESDLIECGIDVRAASVYSGVLTQIFVEERGLYQDKVFCFIHLSIQEFLAALHVHQTFITSGVNLVEEQNTEPKKTEVTTITKIVFYQNAVDKALLSPNGHLDLFLRFLLGLSVQTNQNLLRGLLTKTESSSKAINDTIQYVKEKIERKQSTEKYINLFHCLNELNDNLLVEEIQNFLSSRSISTDKMSPAQWSALVFILLSSEKDLEVFDLKKYSASEEALLRLLPVVNASNKALLSGCNLSKKSCKKLSTLISTSSLKELDLSNNNLTDKGVKLLSEGLQSPHCGLEVLRLSGCLVTEQGCASLASALASNSHLKELDLSYNHPGETGENLLKAAVKKPPRRLKTVLRLDHAGVQMLTAGPRKYVARLTLDLKTAHKNLKLSDDNRKVNAVEEEQPYPDNPDRFDHFQQLLCSNGLTGRSYWEVEWKGMVNIGITYKGIRRKGENADCILGGNDQSWSLFCSGSTYSFHHNSQQTEIPALSNSDRVGVYLDWPSGSLSFYKISPPSDLIHLHTISTKFTEPVYPAFRVGFQFGYVASSVSLCELK